MKSPIILLALAVAVSSARGSSLRVDGGTLALGGGAVSATSFQLGAGGTLGGDGEIQAAATLAGTVSPGTSVSNVGTLRFTKDVRFAGGTYRCHADGNTALDRIVAAGNVDGTATVQMSKKSSHVIPLWQIMVEGAAGSDYSGFVPSRPDNWRLETTNTLDLMVTDLIGDTNMDGMPDWWEQWHFDGRTAAGATGDPDDDRFPNRSEYLAGTDPNDDESLLRIEESRLLPGDAGYEVRWQSVPGKWYRLVGCDAALTGQWFDVTQEIPAEAGGGTTWTNVEPVLPRFHAVRLVVP
ncbi:MAG: hypothetical protein EOM72_03665 [Opitutae bacterium]|nr:hypothetical protein [Opitutae bacterium]